MRIHTSHSKKPNSQALPQPQKASSPQSMVMSPLQAKSNEEGLAEWEAQREKWARLGSPWMHKVPNPSGDLAQPWIQQKLPIKAPHHTSQQGAESVIAQRFPLIQRQLTTSPCGNRTGIPERLKSGLEHLSGMDLSQVKVHHNSAKPAQVNALAYAQGTDIHLGPGQETYLPHEGWHVVQQMQGRVRPTTTVNGYCVNNHQHLEHEADMMGQKAAQMRTKSIIQQAALSVSRRSTDYANSSVSGIPIQCFAKSDLKNGLGSEFLEKHVANVNPPSLDSREAQENVIESVYYNRPRDDRKSMNTVFFESPGIIEQDLRSNINGDEVDYNTEYTTQNTYPAITVLRVFQEKEDKYARAQIQHGRAKPCVKVNKGDGTPSFNHLQKTEPRKLENTIDLLEE